MEKWTQNDLIGILTKSAEHRGIEFDDCDKIFFYGAYSGNIASFSFLLGDRMVIHRLVKHVRDSIERDPKHFIMPKNFKILRKNTVELSVGLFFGQYSLNSIPKTQNDKLKTDLFKKVEDAMNSMNLIPIRPISEEIVKVINIGDRVRADVICAFCPENNIGTKKPKVISVQAFAPPNSSAVYWTIGNLKKHLKSHNNIEEKKKDNIIINDTADRTDKSELNISVTSSCDVIMIDQTAQNTVNHEQTQTNTNLKIEIEPISEFAIGTENDMENDRIYKQISHQMIEVSKSVVISDEITENMEFKVGDETKFVQVAKIPGNGGCLFGAMAHQLFYQSIGTDQITNDMFVERTSELRAQVVAFIEENYERYENALKGRIYDNEDEKMSKKRGRKKALTHTEIEKKCKSFLKNDLPKQTCWAGYESLMAISELYKVNIIIFREMDIFNFVDGFNQSYERTACLAYRLAGKPKKTKAGVVLNYNHYDSICGINSNVMFTCAETLKLIFLSQEKNVGDMDNSVIDVTSD